jgi:hypothetical protein
MKLSAKTLFSLLIIGVSFVATINSLNLKQAFTKSVVVDKTADPSLEFAIRRNPTVTSEVKYTPANQQAAKSQSISFSNTNDNNGPDVRQPEFGRSAEIVGPSIWVHQKGKLSVVHDTPAHVGWRNEITTITSLNKDTSKNKILYR